MTRFKVKKKKDLKIIKFKSLKDKRGVFSRIYCLQKFKKINLDKIVQINLVKTKKRGTIRGFHYQIGRFSEDKLIFVLKGSIFDVCLNLNRRKKNFLKVNQKILHQSNNEIILIPKGYAHAYQTLENDTHILYLTTNFYNKAKERQFNPLSKFFNIKWPLKNITLSKKDLNSKHYAKDKKKKSYHSI